ncbi:MAG: hypothetical protein IPN92_20745 [Chromatiaceae bacterium]|nr:hypothetical protein [Chromatiaceae bacterium]
MNLELLTRIDVAEKTGSYPTTWLLIFAGRYWLICPTVIGFFGETIYIARR